jgi:hypothetical protein
MTADGKKPGVSFWATVVVVVLLVAYPLSFGPACWIASRVNSRTRTLPAFYRPLISAMSTSETIYRAGKWYSELGAADRWGWIGIGADPYWIYMPPEGL